MASDPTPAPLSAAIAVTGLGMISPIGLDVASAWVALIAGQSGVDTISAFDHDAFPCHVAAEVKGFDPAAYGIDPKAARRMDRFVQFGLAASLEALHDAGLPVPVPDGPRTGVYIGSGMGGLLTLSEQYEVLRQRGPGRVSPFLVPMMIADMASGQVSIAVGAQGPNLGIVSACATGAHAIGEAAALIHRGDVDVMIAGGAEAAITPIAVAGFAAARALTSQTDPSLASRPFDRHRDGFVIGEGAGMLVLERFDHARRRGARVYALLAGYGSSADAYHLTAPPEDGAGAVRCMRQALASSGLRPEDLDYINAHGTSTPLNDRAETIAMKTALGPHAYRLPISSTKSMMGHLLGAAGAVEAIVAIKAIETGVVPPTINYRTPDPDCDLDYVPNEARHQRVRTAMSNSFGFGGHNATLLFRAAEEE